MDEAVPLSTSPKEGQLVQHDGKTYRTIREGHAFILVPPDAKTSQDPRSQAKAAVKDDDQRPQSVFYNPIQQFNRDLSVLAIKAFGEDLCARRRAKWERNYQKLGQKKEHKKEKKRRLDEKELTSGDPVKALKSEDGLDVTTGRESLVEATGQAGEITDRKSAGEAPLNGSRDDSKLIGEDGNLDEGMPPDAAQGNGNTKLLGHESETAAADGHTTSSKAESGSHPNGTTTRGPSFRILDALSATGLRALRYAKEIPFATSITANDMDRKAVRSIELHIKHNDLAHKIRSVNSNALAHMYGVAHPPQESHGPTHVSAKYDVIDLDPYGTAAPFIDAALQALNDGGLLCVTCTDSAVFASCGYPEKTYSLYGGMPAKGPHCHETGLRLVLHSIASAAARYGLAVEPLLSLSIDFYVRVFVRVRRSPADVKFLAGKTMVVHECDIGCGATATQLFGRNTKKAGKGDGFNWKHSIAQAPNADRHCEHCGQKTHVAGPMWAGPLHHPGFVSKILEDVETLDRDVYATTTRIEGMLSTALDELLDTDYVAEHGFTDALVPKMAPELLDRQPFFFIPSALAKVLHTQAPSEAAIKGALRHAGYRVSRSHCKPGSVKTNAPWSAVWEIMREWVRQRSPVKKEKYREGSAGWRIMGFDVQTNSADEKEVVHHDSATEHRDINNTELNGNQTKMKVVFDEALGRDKPGKKLVRYQTNPRENWGPMSRAR